MYPPHQPDRRSRDAREHQVYQQNALQFLPLELELPRENSRGQDRKSRDRRGQQVVVDGVSQAALFRPLSEQVKRHCHNEQRDWKMNQHDMLRVLRQKYCLEVERICHIVSIFPTAILYLQVEKSPASRALVGDNRSESWIFPLGKKCLFASAGDAAVTF